MIKIRRVCRKSKAKAWFRAWLEKHETEFLRLWEREAIKAIMSGTPGYFKQKTPVETGGNSINFKTEVYPSSQK